MYTSVAPPRTFRRPEVRQTHLELRDTSKGGQRILDMLKQNGFAPPPGTCMAGGLT